MKNKLLLLIIVLLIPVAVFVGNKKKDISNNDEVKEEVVVNLNKNNEVIRLSLNDYLIGVVGQEMPASFNYEALKAQAVAVRTFAYNYYDNNEINIADSVQHYISTEEMKNKWGNEYDKYYNKIKDSVLETNNEVIMYNNNIIKSYYYAISNGKSEDSMTVFNEELPYLKIVDSSFDQDVKNFEVTTSFTYDNFCLLLSLNNCNIDISNIKKDDSNRVELITINDKEYLGIDIRKKLNLRSTDFEIELLNDSIEIKTKGYGHGVGMSQYGANYLANKGYNYQNILKYYYKDVEIKKY